MKEQVRTLVIQNDTGLHCRSSASFVKLASQFQSDIFVEKDGEQVNGKSILGLLTLGASSGTKINVTAVGSDASKALDALEDLVKNNFTPSNFTLDNSQIV